MSFKCYLFILLSLIVFPLSSYGESQNIVIPTQGWSIAFDAPALLQFKGNSNKSEFQYSGSSEEGFNISIFVEDKKNNKVGNKSVYEFYWPMAKKNPQLDKATVKILQYKKFIKVSYLIKGVHEKIGKYEIPHENYYFEFNVKWVDVHISKFPYTNEDKLIFEKFVKSLKYIGS